MAIKITEQLLTPGASHGRTGTKLVPKGIVIHYVGNPGSSASGNRNWFENGAGGAYTSAHYIVGLQGEILRLIPENECAQHAGRAYESKFTEQAKKNNSMYIGIECCHPTSAGQFNDLTYAALTSLCEDICQRRGFDPMKDVFRHYDVTGKLCPLYYVNNPSAWTQLLKDIAAKTVPAGSGQVSVRFDLFGKKIVDVPGQLIDGYNYVQARGLLEAMGYTVGWENGIVTVRQ